MKPTPDEQPANQQPAQTPLLRGLQDRPRCQQRGQHEEAVNRVVAVRDDADRRDRQRQRRQQPRHVAKRAPHEDVEHDDRGHACQRLREQDAEAAVTEDLRADRLNPEAERGLVHADEAAGVKGDEEEVVPALHHAADGGGIVEVCIAIGLKLIEVAESGDQRDQEQRTATPWLKEEQRALA